MILGQDYLGGCKYQTAMLAAHKPGQCAGIFMRTFGDARKTVEAMCKSKKFSQIVVHLEPFDKTHAYPKITTGYADAKFCNSLVEKYGVPIGLSMWCEHNKTKAQLLPVFAELKRVAPSCFIVNSIWKGAVVDGVITEIHLESSKLRAKPKGEYFVSFDGFGGNGTGDFSDADLQAIIAFYWNASQIRGWDFRYNGKFSHTDKTPIPNRKSWPSKEYIKGKIASLKYEREGNRNYPNNVLYKSFGDDHGAPEPTKDNRAMIISPEKAASMSVLDSNGNKIDTMTRVLPDYNGAGSMKGHARYYSKKYAYQIAEAARKKTGSGLIKIGKLPLTDGDLRSGQFK